MAVSKAPSWQGFRRLFQLSHGPETGHNPLFPATPGGGSRPSVAQPTRLSMSFSAIARGAPSRPASRQRQLGSLAKPLLALLALAILGASATAITYLITQPGQIHLFGNNATTEASSEQLVSPRVPTAAAPTVPIFLKLDPFTVTIANEYSERLMHVGIVLSLNSVEAEKRLFAFMPIVRSRILLLLSDQNPETVNTAAAKRDLERTIRQVANGALDTAAGQRVNEVLFTDFVVQ